MPLIHVKKNYQVTIPQQIRNTLKIKVGDLMEAEIEKGLIILKPKSVVDKNELDPQKVSR